MAGEDQIEVQTETSTAQTPPTKRGRAAPAFSVGAAVADQDNRDVWEFLKDISSAGVVKIKLERMEPEFYEGVRIKGFCCEYDRFFEEQEILQRYGGGRFQITVYQTNGRGGWQGGNKRSFNISGNPKITGEQRHDGGEKPAAVVAAPSESPAVVSQAMGFMASLTEKAQARAERAENRPRDDGADSAAWKMMDSQLSGMRQEMGMLRQALADKDAKIVDLISRPPPKNDFQEKILGNMLEGETARIEGLRTRHESELRQVMENARRDVQQERERFSDELKSRERAHEREIATLRETLTSSQRSSDQAHESRVDGFKGRISDLERALTEAKAEVIELRTRKEKTLADSMQEVSAFKGMLEEFNGGGNEESSVAERIVGAIVQSPMAQAIGRRLETAPPTAPVVVPAQQQRRRRPQNQRPSRQVVVPAAGTVAADGSTVQSTAEPQRIDIDQEELAMAIMFMETAAQKNADPANFAASARASVPGSIIQAIRVLGIDKFMTDVARLPESSPLANGTGRNWLRKVAKHLLGDTSPEAPPAAEETPEPDL